MLRNSAHVTSHPLSAFTHHMRKSLSFSLPRTIHHFGLA